MSENDQSEEIQKEREVMEDQLFRAYHWEGTQIDWFLQETVESANEQGFEVGITLTTASGLISGILIGASKYFSLYADNYVAAIPEELREETRKYLVEKGQLDEEKIRFPAQYIHLRDAFLHTGNKRLPASVGFLWRGKISGILGFTLGRFGTD